MNIQHKDLSLPLPAAPDDVGAWPEVCLAEIWQPQKDGSTKLGPYKRKLFAAPDWKTLWKAIDKTAVWQPALRPVAITKYSCGGTRFPLLIKVVNFSLQHPRLFAVDGVYRGPHHEHSGLLLPALPLLQLQALAERLPAAWEELATAAVSNLQAIGVILHPNGKITEQPLTSHDHWIDRTQWQHESESRYTRSRGDSGPYGKAARNAFMQQAIITEANLVSLALHEAQPPESYLNKGIIALLQKRGRRDPMAPHNMIEPDNSTRQRTSRRLELTIFPAKPH